MRFQSLIICLALAASATTPTLAGEWKAGVAKVKITPTKPLRMGGYSSRNRPADGTLTDLWAKALVLQDGTGTRAMLITIDVNNISRDLSTAVCRELHKQFALERQSIALNALHTHSGPAMGERAYYTFTEQEHQDLKDYTTDLRRKLIAVAGEALRHLAPARLSWGNGKSSFAVNRRNNPEADVSKLRAEGKLRGPVDHDVPVLFVQDSHVKQELGSDRTWVAGYSNDVLAYIPSRRVLLEGGYEGGGAMLYYGHPGLWAEGIERKIVHEVHRQVGLKTHGE